MIYKSIVPQLLLVCVCLLCACEQDESTDTDELFIKFYGDAGSEVAVDFIITDNEEYVILGRTDSPFLLNRELGESENEVDYYLIFTDRYGNPKREATYTQKNSDASFTDSRDIPSAIRRTSDGGYLLVGTSTYNIKEPTLNTTEAVTRQSDVFVVKVDAEGNEIFSKTYGDYFYKVSDGSPCSTEDIQGGENCELSMESGADIVEHTDGYIIFGATNNVNRQKSGSAPGMPFNFTEDAQDFFLVKISKDGTNQQWKRTTGFEREESAISILPISNGESVIMGTTSKVSQSPEPGAGGKNILFARINTEGEIEGAGFYGNAGDEIPKRMHKISNQDFYIVGTYQEASSEKGFLMEVTVNANDRFLATSIGPENVNVRANDALRIPSIGYWVAGRLEDEPAKSAEMLLMRTGASGLLDQAFGRKEIGGINYGGVDDDELVRILNIRSSRNLVLLGTLGFEGGSTMIALIKTTPEGRLSARN